MASVIRRFFEINTVISRAFDRLFSETLLAHPNTSALQPKNFLHRGMVVADVGGGKKPYLSAEDVQSEHIFYVGLDIDPDELAAAPAGAYSEVMVFDLTDVPPEVYGKFDLIFCRCTLEHVQDADAAISGLTRMLKPGGLCYLAAPGRKALFARLNLIIPQGLKRRILHYVYPHKSGDGFPVFYDRSTPGEYREILEARGMQIDAVSLRYWSSYFTAFFPAHFLWRLFSILQIVFINDYCERFEMVFRKPSGNLATSKSEVRSVA